MKIIVRAAQDFFCRFADGLAVLPVGQDETAFLVLAENVERQGFDQGK
jgi:hypothetical protein